MSDEFDGLRESEFESLAATCDGLLRLPGAPPGVLAAPVLHVVSSHPALLRTQLELKPSGTAELARHLRNVLVPGGGEPLPMAACDVLLVGGLVDPTHLGRDADFYFGHLQEMLESEGLTSLLLLRNQSGAPTRPLRSVARRRGGRARMLLPDRASAVEELRYWKEARRARSHLRAELEGVADGELRDRIRAGLSSASTTANLRLEAQVREVVRTLRPSIVIVMWEGHAWERCVFRGARQARPDIHTVGYQHTILRKHVHAMRRSLPGVDPERILSMGEATRADLAGRAEFAAEYTIFGTHRRQPGAAPGPCAPTGPCLVIPEGLEKEAAFLFGACIDLARANPTLEFIFRSHPVLPYDRVPGLAALPDNVSLSDGRSIEEDFARCGSVIYRGSSAVIYAMLSGLRPYYFGRPNELTLDPVHALDAWREILLDPADFPRALRADQEHADEDRRRREWERARDFCLSMALEERPEAAAVLAREARKRTDVRH